MPEHDLELRLHAVARELDVRAPSFDPARLSAARPRPMRRRLVALACLAALVGVAAAPTAVSSLQRLFEIDDVTDLGPLAPGVAPPFAGRAVPVDTIQASAPFPVRTISSLGAPDAARVRDDIAGGMVTIAYARGRTLLTQWRTTDVSARITLVPAVGRAEDVAVGDLPALWIEGAARGTFTLTGADGTTHREAFGVSPGVLLWNQDGMTFLLQGAASSVDAVRLAGDVAR